jgi:hypothetical protein
VRIATVRSVPIEDLASISAFFDQYVGDIRYYDPFDYDTPRKCPIYKASDAWGSFPLSYL